MKKTVEVPVNTLIHMFRKEQDPVLKTQIIDLAINGVETKAFESLVREYEENMLISTGLPINESTVMNCVTKLMEEIANYRTPLSQQPKTKQSMDDYLSLLR